MQLKQGKTNLRSILLLVALFASRFHVSLLIGKLLFFPRWSVPLYSIATVDVIFSDLVCVTEDCSVGAAVAGEALPH